MTPGRQPLAVLMVAVGLAGCAPGDPAAVGPPVPPPMATPFSGRVTDLHAVNWERARFNFQTIPQGDRVVEVDFPLDPSGCRRFVKATVEERPDVVAVTVWVGDDSDRAARRPCPSGGVLARARVLLKSPIGNRIVEDGAAAPPGSDHTHAK